MNELVAVYGTLKQFYHNHRVMPSGSELVGLGVGVGKMVSLGGFPGILKDTLGSYTCELWSVTDITPLDRLEGNGSFYTREKRPIILDDGDEVEAWVYMLPADEYNEYETVELGVW